MTRTGHHRRSRFPARIEPGAASPCPSIGSWLDLLTSLLDLPDEERRGVRDELESHLRDRVRDLIVSGETEDAAAAIAIAELGDAAMLARRFKQAIGPSKRRLIMNVAALSIAGAAIVFSAIAVVNTRTAPSLAAACPPEATTPEEVARRDAAVGNLLFQQALVGRDGTLELVPMLAPVEGGDRLSRAAMAPVLQRLMTARAGGDTAIRCSTYEPPADEAMDRLSKVPVEWTGEGTWDNLFQAAGRGTGLRAVPVWDRLDEIGIKPDGKVKRGPETSLGALFARASEESEPLAARIQGEQLIFAPAGFFDNGEQQLAVYDLSPLVARRAHTGEPESIINETIALVSGLVFPDHWVPNGGDRASASSFGAKVFIQAPARFHDKVRWVLDQVLAEEAQPLAWAPRPMSPLPPTPATIAPPLHSAPPAAPTTAPAPPRGGLAPAVQPSPAPRRPDEHAPSGVPGGAAREDGVVYLAGSVERPGVYALPASGITLQRLLTAAGGPSQPLAGLKVRVTRANTVISLDPVAGATDPAEDLSLKPGDRVDVLARLNLDPDPQAASAAAR